MRPADIPDGDDPSSIIERAQALSAISAALLSLPPRYEYVLRAQFGISVREPMKLKAIGDRLGVSVERVRQIAAAALRKLKGKLREAAETFGVIPRKPPVPRKRPEPPVPTTPPGATPPWHGWYDRYDAGAVAARATGRALTGRAFARANWGVLGLAPPRNMWGII